VANYCSAAEKQTRQIQSSVMKTMFLVSMFFAITWTPLDVYYLLSIIDYYYCCCCCCCCCCCYYYY